MRLFEILNLIENQEIEIYLNFKYNYRGRIIKNENKTKYEFDVDLYSDLQDLEVKEISSSLNSDGKPILIIIVREDY